MTYLPTETSTSIAHGDEPEQAASGSVALDTRPEPSETPKLDLSKKPKVSAPEQAAPDITSAVEEDTAPEPLKLIGVTVWGFALTVLGLVLTGVLAALAATAPPTATGDLTPALLMIPVCGLLGLGLVIASLVTISREKVPYILLGCSTLVLCILFGFVIAA